MTPLGLVHAAGIGRGVGAASSASRSPAERRGREPGCEPGPRKLASTNCRRSPRASTVDLRLGDVGAGPTGHALGPDLAGRQIAAPNCPRRRGEAARRLATSSRRTQASSTSIDAEEQVEEMGRRYDARDRPRLPPIDAEVSIGTETPAEGSVVEERWLACVRYAWFRRLARAPRSPAPGVHSTRQSPSARRADAGDLDLADAAVVPDSLLFGKTARGDVRVEERRRDLRLPAAEGAHRVPRRRVPRGRRLERRLLEDLRRLAKHGTASKLCC